MAQQSSDSSKLSSRFRSVEARFLDCMSQSEAYYKKQSQRHLRRSSKRDEPEEPPRPVVQSFSVSSVRRVRKIDDDYDDADEENDEFPPVQAQPAADDTAASIHNRTFSMTSAAGPRPRRSASRASYSSLPYGARRPNRASWSTQDFQEYLERERENEWERASRPGSIYSGGAVPEEPPSIEEAVQNIQNDPARTTRTMSLTNTPSQKRVSPPPRSARRVSKSNSIAVPKTRTLPSTDVPDPGKRPRSIIDSDVYTRPSSSAGSAIGSPRSGSLTAKHQRVYSDFQNHAMPEVPKISPKLKATPVSVAA